MSSPPRTWGAQELYALVNSIDDAALDARRWPSVVSKLTEFLPLDPTLLPEILPSRQQTERILQEACQQSRSGEYIELLEFICTRLKRAADIHDKLAETQTKSRAATRALDHSHRAIVLVDTAAKVLTTNSPADEILAQKDGLYIDRQYLRASRSDVDLELRRAIGLVSSRKFRWVAQSVPRMQTTEQLNLLLEIGRAHV